MLLAGRDLLDASCHLPALSFSIVCLAVFQLWYYYPTFGQAHSKRELSDGLFVAGWI
jgi:hypothetical protein